MLYASLRGDDAMAENAPLNAPLNEANGMIQASLTYGVDTGEKSYYEVLGHVEVEGRTGKQEQREVTIHDGRLAGTPFTLDEHGFEFITHRSAVEDFSDESTLRRVYYPETERIILECTGAERAFVFDHTLRHGDGEVREIRKIRAPVFSAHNDYTEWSAPKRVRDFLPDEADALLARRYAIVQVWRPVNRPVQSLPLAIADARTIEAEDLITLERRSPGRTGETYELSFNPRHRWYYFPAMRPDEALVFKVFDSATDGRARYTAHTAFEDPSTPANAAPRESIEMRVFAFFEE